MQFVLYLSQFMIPFLIFYVIGCGLLTKVPVYDSFVRGAREGLQTVVRIVPTLIGLMVAAGVLRASGFLDFLASGRRPNAPFQPRLCRSLCLGCSPRARRRGCCSTCTRNTGPTPPSG